MTSEVALMNRLAVALAADSATTITYWEGGRRLQRYFKGANKIFNLSVAHPVGLMTYGSGNLQGVPWEVAGKGYRASRGGKGLDRLADYPKDFFKYLGSKELFSTAYQEKHMIRGVSETAGNIAGGILIGRDEIRNETDEGKKKTLAGQRFSEVTKEVEGASFLTDDCKKLAEEIRNKHLPKIAAEFKSGDAALSNTSAGASSSAPLSSGAWTTSPRSSTLRSALRSLPSHRTTWSTFVFGASLNALVAMGRNCAESLDELVKGLVDAGQLAAGFDTTELKQTAATGFRDRVREYIWEQHATPLRRVIGMLPVDELAALAETFVSIEFRRNA